MAFANYTELVAEIITRTKRTDQAALVPTYILLAEAQISRTLRVRQMLGRSNATIDAEYSALPSDYAGLRSILLTTGSQELQPLSADEMEARSLLDTGTGEPMHYAVEGTELRFSPVPSGSYTARLSYYRRIPGLQANATNWLLTAYPDAYLYGALEQFGLHVEDDVTAAKYGALFQRTLAEIKRIDSHERISGSRLRSDFPTQNGGTSLNDFLHGRA